MDCTSKPRSELGLLRLEKDRNEQISSERNGHFCLLSRFTDAAHTVHAREVMQHLKKETCNKCHENAQRYRLMIGRVGVFIFHLHLILVSTSSALSSSNQLSCKWVKLCGHPKLKSSGISSMDSH